MANLNIQSHTGERSICNGQCEGERLWNLLSDLKTMKYVGELLAETFCNEIIFHFVGIAHPKVSYSDSSERFSHHFLILDYLEMEIAQRMMHAERVI